LSRFEILKQVTDFADNNTQDSTLARITLPAAISRSAVTISRLSDCMSGLAPRRSWRARFDASNTSSKRLEIFAKQSSTVIRAIVISNVGMVGLVDGPPSTIFVHEKIKHGVQNRQAVSFM
jgi:hypothetical protein